MSAYDRAPSVAAGDEPDVLGDAMPVAKDRDWRTVLTAGIGVTGVAVAATGIAVAVGLSGGGPQPEDVLPADVFAMAKLDLDPSGDQKLAAYDIAERFPELEVDSARRLSDDVLRVLFEGNEQIDYEKQVRPWIGSRAAVAGAPDADGDATPEALLAVAYEDRARAEQELPGLLDAAGGGPAFFAFSSREPYVLIAQSQAAADAAADASSVLADAASYRGDLDALGGDQVAVAWADLDAAWSAAGPEAQDVLGTVYGEQFTPSGRFIAGLHLEPDAVEVIGQSVDLDLGDAALSAYALGSGPGSGLIEQLPADAAAAMSLAGLGDQLLALFELLPLGVVGPAGGSPEQDLAQLEEELGIALPEDLAVLLGQETAVGVFARDGEVEVGARSTGTDTDAALAVAERLLASASTGIGLFGGYTVEQCLTDSSVAPPAGLSVTEMCQGLPSAAETGPPPGVVGPADDGVAFGTTEEVLQRMTESSGLGDTDPFQRAVPDADDAGAVLYADLQALLPLLRMPQDDLDRARPLEALGMTSSGGPDGRFRLRLTLD